MRIRDIKKQIRKAEIERESILYVSHTHPNIDKAYIDTALSNIEFKIVSLEDVLRILKKKRLGRIVIGLIITSIVTLITLL
jgi:hypothetical protein